MNDHAEPSTATAHRYWDQVWRSSDGCAPWSEPDPWVVATMPRLRALGARRVLDLGCGLGRHALYLASVGFNCVAVDASHAAIASVAADARGAGLELELREAGFTELPDPDGSFDYVLAFNVIYHGDEATVSSALTDIRRVLRPGGLYQCTMLSKRNSQYGRGIEIAPNTFVQPGADDDKTHPHLYCDIHDLLRLHTSMELLAVETRDQGAPGSEHWHCLFWNP